MLTEGQFTPFVMCSQITDGDFCNKIQKLFESGKEVKVMVSPRIVSYSDYKAAQVSTVM